MEFKISNSLQRVLKTFVCTPVELLVREISGGKQKGFFVTQSNWGGT